MCFFLFCFYPNLILVAVSRETDELDKSEMSNYLTNFHVLVFTIISTFFIILVITGACFCIRARKFFFFNHFLS